MLAHVGAFICAGFFVARNQRRHGRGSAQARPWRPGGGAAASPAGSATVYLRLLDGKLSFLANGQVVGVQADDLVVVLHRLVRLAQFAVQDRPVAQALDVLPESRAMARPKSSTARWGSPRRAQAQRRQGGA